eukprot:UN04640
MPQIKYNIDGSVPNPNKFLIKTTWIYPLFFLTGLTQNGVQ